MNVKELLATTTDYFKKYGLKEPRLDAEVLLAHVLKKERIQLYVDFDQPLKADELNEYRQLVYKRARQYPVAYLLGKKEFMSLDFTVNEDVLIPRPETEELVEKLIEYCQSRNLTAPNIADIGTGSGAIAVSLAYYIKEARVLAIDISPGALKVARENISKYGLEERVKALEGDLLIPLLWMNKDNVDIVVSNPPYIDHEGMAELAGEVRREPEIALNGGIDGLDYYRRLIPQALKVLKDDGLLALEIGYDQAAAVRELFDANWTKVEVKKDYSGHDRMVFAYR
ncbi:MAG: peptide chain release factor N(5)-glutamine methyltransferase [Halanaerobiales bacterium]|jgi:release factor glutamine methyltransferase|nr:peptide chain release factor N(5)-glutamine methyltransferase [Bacillota bacterium]HOA40159.1 peptide chain release factor N(5)-glutamine methyltransferase [Halanaerobiales bacterium]HPZ62441.1 peptide chain release factor N(5)-glutamine methyltransferase [Halanaerobiales bacterium]HQD03677.1 peptide chain release factor N(5)-glutamine methyltransferase [Halanaerobiales bacterium]